MGIGRVYAFVVRLWFEQSGAEREDGEWRGEARDVESGSVQRFRFLEGMTGAVQKLLRRAEGEPDEPS